MSISGEYGTHVEIQALADVLQRPFEIYSDVESQSSHLLPLYYYCRALICYY